MAKGELDRASRLAQALRRKFPDPAASYLVGRAELLLRAARQPPPTRCAPPPTAIRTTRSCCTALGLAEAAAQRDDRALEAYRRALADNANHIATIIDRALLQVDRGTDRDAARGALEGVVGKLVGDSSPGQLARAFLGLAELELQKGDVTAARRDLAQAAAKRRDGDALLSEELAQAFADAYMLDEAEREAKRAIAGRRAADAAADAGRGGAASRAAAAGAGGDRGGGHVAARGAGDARAGVADARAQGDGAARRRGGAARSQPRHLVGGQGGAGARRHRRRPSGQGAAHADGARAHARRSAPTWRRRSAMVFVARSVPDRARWWLERGAQARSARRRGAAARWRGSITTSASSTAAREELQARCWRPTPTTRRRGASWRCWRSTTAIAVAARDELDALLATDDNVDLETLMNAARAHLLLGDGAGAEERVQRAQKLPTAPQAAEELLDLLGARAARRAQAGRRGGAAAQGAAERRCAARPLALLDGRLPRPRAAGARRRGGAAWRRRERASASRCWWRGRGWRSSAAATRWPKGSRRRRSRGCAGRGRRARSRPRPTRSSGARSTSRARSSRRCARSRRRPSSTRAWRAPGTTSALVD